jgi:hypothetical protein
VTDGFDLRGRQGRLEVVWIDDEIIVPESVVLEELHRGVNVSLTQQGSKRKVFPAFGQKDGGRSLIRSKFIFLPFFRKRKSRTAVSSRSGPTAARGRLPNSAA